MGLLTSLKKWVFGDDSGEEVDEEVQSRDAGPKQVARRVPKLPPVMSDALETASGGLQGLAWYWTAFVCDEWGTVANDFLEPTPEGLSRRQGRRISLHNLVYSCVNGVVDVRIEAPKVPESVQSTGPKKRPAKHKKRNRGR